MEEKKNNHVLIEGIAEDVLKEMLRFIYTGKVFDIDKLAFGSIQAVDRYDVPHLKKCEQLIRSISIDHCIEYFSLADRINAIDLEDKAIEYINANGKSLIDKIKVLILSSTQLIWKLNYTIKLLKQNLFAL